MDGLAQDLTLALHESSKELQQTVRRHNRKRKGKGRRNSNSVCEDMNLYAVDFPNRSEASGGSDMDSILRGHASQPGSSTKVYAIPMHIRRNLSPAIEATTDSEDQCSRIANKLSALSLPTSGSFVSNADFESDSVNEISVERKTTDHARRRRRAKLNASPSIVVGSAPVERSFTPENERKLKPRPHGKKKENMNTDVFSECKSKSQRMESEPAGYISMLNVDTGYYDISSESSLLTSDGEETCDDHAGEADDEQSDVFYEVGEGTTYGIPIKSQTMDVNSDSQTPTNQMHLHSVMQHNSFPHTISYSKLKRAKYGKYGRPIKTGYRRFKHVNKVYQSSSEQSQDCFMSPSSLSLPCSSDKAAKRRRQLPHSHSSSYAGESKAFNLQLPTNLSWSLSSENRLRSDNSLLFSSTAYRSSHGASARRRRRVLLSANHSGSKPKKKSGST